MRPNQEGVNFYLITFVCIALKHEDFMFDVKYNFDSLSHHFLPLSL